MQIYIDYLCINIGGNSFINRFFTKNKQVNTRTISVVNKALQPVCGALFFTQFVNKFNFFAKK